jgi:D-xylose transport system permease protein
MRKARTLSVVPEEESSHKDLESDQSAVRQVIGQLRSLWQGDTGMIPIVIGLFALVAYFEVRSSVFLSAGNVTNLFVQATVFVLLGMAEIWLLLLGEIDLSLGYNAGLGGALAAIVEDNQFHWPWPYAIILAVLVTTVVGLLWGYLVIKLRLPSFVVTLAGLLGLEGVLIFAVDRQGLGGTIPIKEKVLYDLVNGNLTTLATWIFVAVIVAYMSYSIIRTHQQRSASGLENRPFFVVIIKVVLMAASGLVLVLYFNTNRGTFTELRGMPFAVPIVFGVLAIGSLILKRTKAGRYMYAIGGNAEAARRAGVNVNRYKLLAFGLTGVTAGIAGLLYASWLGGMSDNINGGNLVLLAVASAVIGGTSLFGGRGKLTHALVGGIIIATIYNGMALIGMSAATQYIATALVLLAAVTVDSLARRGNTTTG